MFRALAQPPFAGIALAAAGLLMVTMGTRQSFGLFLAPIDASTGLGVAALGALGLRERQGGNR